MKKRRICAYPSCRRVGDGSEFDEDLDVGSDVLTLCSSWLGQVDLLKFYVPRLIWWLTVGILGIIRSHLSQF